MATNQESLAIAWNRFQAGDLHSARKHLLGLTAAEPSFTQAWYLLGSVNQLLGNTTRFSGELPACARARPQSCGDVE